MTILGTCVQTIYMFNKPPNLGIQMACLGEELVSLFATSQRSSIQFDVYYFATFQIIGYSLATRSASHKVIISFLEDIIARFGCPSRIVIDNAASFRSEPLIRFCEQFQISLIHSTPYYPQGNGLAKSSNKSLIRIIKRLLEDNKRAQD